MDYYVKRKKEEKIDKYMDLAAEVRKKFRVKTLIVPIVLGALRTVLAKLSEKLKKLKTCKTAVLISTIAILRRVLNF